MPAFLPPLALNFKSFLAQNECHAYIRVNKPKNLGMTHKDALNKIASVLKRTVFGKQKFESGKLSDGTVVEYTALEPGGEISVMDDEEKPVPAPVGEHELEDGRIVVVTEAGKIAEILEAAPSEAEKKAAKKAEEKKPEEMAEEGEGEGEGKTPPKVGLDWSQQIDDLKRQMTWQAERIASLQNAISMFRADASEVFATFHEYVQLDSAAGGKAITKPGQSVFAEARKTKADAQERFSAAMAKYNKRLQERAVKS